MGARTFHRTALVILVATLSVAGLWWKCRIDPAINFLPADHRANWIVFPAPIQAGAHRIAMLDTVFRREFQLSDSPKSAQLQIRAARRVELKINGGNVDLRAPANWKSIASLDVAGFLHDGANTIEARVFNDDAPPAFWLRLSIDDLQLLSDNTWQASFVGSAWRLAAVAATPKFAGAGNLLAGGETSFAAMARIWPIWLGFAVIAVVVLIAGTRWVITSPWQTPIVFGIAAAAWIVLFWHNASLLPFVTGYDSTDHAAYIKYLHEHGALPLPNQGYEMFQPPLYYAVSAGALSLFRLSMSDPNAVLLLRALTMVFGITHFGIVLLCLRLLFPERRDAQVIGFLLAAFLPMQLYLSHYVTNETLAALLVSTSIYFALRILNRPAPQLWEYVSLAFCVGAAMLAKATSLLLLPAVLGALIVKAIKERSALRPAIANLGATLVAIFATCGWYYIWIWRHFGKPIVGNWERALGFNWWQDPGFHTSVQYFRLGRALFDPLFSGYNSFADGIYSTLWGDALGGGLSDMLSRTPWNYNLVVGGYWLALIPTALIVMGVVIAIARFVRQPSAEWFLLLGFSAVVGVALVFMTLKVASYAQVKAFYGLSTLVPLCALAALGWTKLERAPRLVRSGLVVLFLIWTLNSFCSVWIEDSANQRIYAARRLLRDRQLDRAVDRADQAVQKDPSNPIAHCLLAAILDETGRSSEALDEAKRGLGLDNNNGHCQLQMAIDIARQGDISQAMNLAQRLVELEPENSRAYDLWFGCARELRQTYNSIAIAKDALTVSPFDADLHYRAGLAAAETGDFTTAVPQFAYAVLLLPTRSDAEQKLHLALVFAAKAANAADQLMTIASAAPDSAILENELAWIFATADDATVRNAGEAVRLAERACALTNRSRPKFLATLAAAYAEAGKFSEAVAAAQESLSLARSTGDTSASYLADKILASVQNQQSYRDDLSR